MARFLHIFFISIVLMGSVNAREKIYMPNPSVLNLDPSYEISITGMFKSYCEDEGRYEIILSEDQAIEGVSETREEARSQAMKMQIPYYLITTLTGLSNVVISTFTLYRTGNDSLVWSDRIKVYGIEELDASLVCVAQFIGTDRKASASLETCRSSVSESEASQKISVASLGLSLGTAKFFSSLPDFPVSSGFGVMASFSRPKFYFDIAGRFYFGDLDTYHLEMAAYKPIGQRTTRIVLGGGFGYGGMNLISTQFIEIAGQTYRETFVKDGNGIHLFAGPGLIFQSRKLFQLRMNAEYFFSLYHIEGFRNPSGIRLNATFIMKT